MISPLVSLNVLNYNTFEKTKVCIDSCLTQKGIDFRVLLIDNQSTDGSYERLIELYGERIAYLRNDENYGYAKGNNLGVKYSLEHGIQYSFLLNSDTELVGESLTRQLVEVIKFHTACAVVAPTIYDVTSRGNELHPNDSIYLRLLRMGKVLPFNKVLSDRLEEISEAHGSALLVDNKVFLEVKGFPEHYFMYGEESTFAKKILWNNKGILWLKSNENYILHHHDKSNKVDAWRAFLMGRNRSLEYLDNKDRFLLWPLLYHLFKLFIKYQGQNRYYYDGMREAEHLYKMGKSFQEIYISAKQVKEKFDQ